MSDVWGPDLRTEDDSCPCMPCVQRRWVRAWVDGETDRRPPDETLRWLLRRLMAKKETT